MEDRRGHKEGWDDGNLEEEIRRRMIMKDGGQVTVDDMEGRPAGREKIE